MYSDSYFEISNCCPSACWRHPLRPPEARGPTSMQTKLQHWSIPRQLLVPKQISRKCFSLGRHESLQRGQKYFPVFGRGARLPLKILFLFSESATFRVCIRGRLKILLLFSFENNFPFFIWKKNFTSFQNVQYFESSFAGFWKYFNSFHLTILFLFSFENIFLFFRKCNISSLHSRAFAGLINLVELVSWKWGCIKISTFTFHSLLFLSWGSDEIDKY